MSNPLLKESTGDRIVLWMIGVVLVCYGAAVAYHLPQNGTKAVVAHQMPETAGAVVGDPASHAAGVLQHPPYWTVVPFVLLLGAIAVLPLVPATMHWWENNLHRFYVAGRSGVRHVGLLCIVSRASDPRPLAGASRGAGGRKWRECSRDLGSVRQCHAGRIHSVHRFAFQSLHDQRRHPRRRRPSRASSDQHDLPRRRRAACQFDRARPARR